MRYIEKIPTTSGKAIGTSLPTFKDTKKPRYHKSDAIRHLESLANEAARLKYPNVPYLAPRVYRDNNGNNLTKCVKAFLELEGHFCERTGNEGRVIDNRQRITDVLGHTRVIGSMERIYSSGRKGTSDLKAIIQNKFIAIEIKCAATHDRQSEAQRLYQLDVEKSGGIYVIATSFEQFLAWYQSTFWEGLL